MTSPARTYQTEMHRNVGFFATWLPTDPIAIGDVGLLLDGRFRKMSSLSELKIRFSLSDPGAKQNIQYTSNKGVKVDSSAEAGVAEIAKARVTIDLSTEGAFLFQASGVSARRLRNPGQVGRDILAAYRDRAWEKNWLVIEACHE